MKVSPLLGDEGLNTLIEYNWVSYNKRKNYPIVQSAQRASLIQSFMSSVPLIVYYE